MKDDRMEILEELVVCILNTNPPYEFVGHGVLIQDSGLILTTCHLFLMSENSDNEDCRLKKEIGDKDFRLEKEIGDDVMVRLLKGEYAGEFSAEITHLDLSGDIALLKIVDDDDDSKKKFKYGRLARNISIGQTVYMLTTSDGRSLEYTEGTVEFEKRLHSAITNPGGAAYFSRDTPLVQVGNLHGIHGCSGTPVFTERGHLVGVYSFSYGRRDFVLHPTVLQSFCIPAKSKNKKRKRGKEEHDGQVEMTVDEEEVQAVADDERAPVQTEAGLPIAKKVEQVQACTNCSQQPELADKEGRQKPGLKEHVALQCSSCGKGNGFLQENLSTGI